MESLKEWLLPILLVLVCPLMMLFMHKKGGHKH